MPLEPRAEVSLSNSLVEELIDMQFPALAPSSAELIGMGWDNWAYRVNGAYVFRFPRRKIAVGFLESEINVLPLVSSRVSLAVPVPRYIGHADSRFPWPFVGYNWMEGRTACNALLDVTQRKRAAEPLARFLHALHTIPGEVARANGAKGDELGRLDLASRAVQARDRLDALLALGLVKDLRPLVRIVDSVPTQQTVRIDTLVHGDLYARHLLVNETGHLTGIIDWGDVHVGDPAVDLAIALTFLPPEARQDFHRAYGQISPTTWAIARFRALSHMLAIRLHSHEVDDSALISESALALSYLAADI